MDEESDESEASTKMPVSDNNAIVVTVNTQIVLRIRLRRRMLCPDDDVLLLLSSDLRFFLRLISGCLSVSVVMDGELPEFSDGDLCTFMVTPISIGFELMDLNAFSFTLGMKLSDLAVGCYYTERTLNTQLFRQTNQTDKGLSSHTPNRTANVRTACTTSISLRIGREILVAVVVFSSASLS